MQQVNKNFCNALKNQNDIYNYNEPYDNVVLTGLVALYKICFEQAWKAIKEIMEQNGIYEAKSGSPRQILKAAYKSGMIKDETVWLEALASRNNVDHAYNSAVALEIVTKTNEIYYDMFVELKEELTNSWL